MEQSTVLLLHGIGRTPRSLARLERALQRAGFSTRNLAYPWRRLPIPALADDVAARLTGLAETRLSVVTHSMGGLVAAHLLAKRAPECIGRVVMLAPPASS